MIHDRCRRRHSLEFRREGFPDALQAGLEQERFTSVDLVTVSRALTCTCSLYRTTLVNLNAIGLPREDR